MDQDFDLRVADFVNQSRNRRVIGHIDLPDHANAFVRPIFAVALADSDRVRSTRLVDIDQRRADSAICSDNHGSGHRNSLSGQDETDQPIRCASSSHSIALHSRRVKESIS